MTTKKKESLDPIEKLIRDAIEKVINEKVTKNLLEVISPILLDMVKDEFDNKILPVIKESISDNNKEILRRLGELESDYKNLQLSSETVNELIQKIKDVINDTIEIR